jgi:hypothetical protein
VRQARNKYAEIDPDLGDSFLTAVEGAVNRAARRPLSFPAVESALEVRRVLFHGFPYALVFRVLPKTQLWHGARVQVLEVLAVMYQGREPNYWRKRITDR